MSASRQLAGHVRFMIVIATKGKGPYSLLLRAAAGARCTASPRSVRGIRFRDGKLAVLSGEHSFVQHRVDNRPDPLPDVGANALKSELPADLLDELLLLNAERNLGDLKGRLGDLWTGNVLDVPNFSLNIAPISDRSLLLIRVGEEVAPLLDPSLPGGVADGLA